MDIDTRAEKKMSLFPVGKHGLAHIALFAAGVRERVAKQVWSFKEAKDVALQEKRHFIASAP